MSGTTFIAQIFTSLREVAYACLRQVLLYNNFECALTRANKKVGRHL